MRDCRCLILAAALTWASAGSAEVCVSRWTTSDTGPHPSAVKITDADDGELITLDLSALPKGATIYRARLYIGGFDPELREPYKAPRKPETAMAGAEVYILKSAFAPGKAPQLEAKPIPIAGPSFDSLDLTAAIRGWSAGGQSPTRQSYGDGAGNFGLYAKSLPATYDREKVYLDVAYDGAPGKLSPQAAGVSALHRAGQSFITWKDTEDQWGDKPATWGLIRDYFDKDGGDRQVRYRVYRHAKPIDAKSIAEAALIAEVKPLSGFNINSWSLEKLINQVIFGNEDRGELGKYGAFEGWNMWSPQGAKLVIGRLAIEDGKSLPPGTALFVHSARDKAQAYYAVTAAVNGVENLSEFSVANSLAKPVDESPGAWEPVEQPEGMRFGFDFRGKRHYYVRWADAPEAPRPMYFNYSVLVPPDCTKPAPVELYFHGPGGSYARPPAKYLTSSIQVCPHDFPFSGWYGYNDNAGTLKDLSTGVVGPHTIRRVESFLKWVQGKFPVDATRIIAVGGDGAGLMALYRPELLAYVISPGFDGLQLDPKAADGFIRGWGPSSDLIKSETGLSNWQWGEMDVVLTGQRLPNNKDNKAPAPPVSASSPGVGVELPLIICGGRSWGVDPGYARGRGRFSYAVQGTHHAYYGRWGWRKADYPDKHTGLWYGLDITNQTPIAAITGCTADNDREDEGNANGNIRWAPVMEGPDSVEIAVSGSACKFDLTPRRLSKFKLKPGDKLVWEAKTIPADPRTGSTTKPATVSGQVVADAHGLVTLTGLELVRGAANLAVRISRPQ